MKYHFGQDEYMQSRDASQGNCVLGDYTDQGPFDMGKRSAYDSKRHMDTSAYDIDESQVTTTHYHEESY